MYFEAKHNILQQISDLKDSKNNYPIYSGLTKNYRQKSPLADVQPDIMLGSYIEANAFIEGEYDELDSYNKKHFERLKHEFFNKILFRKSVLYDSIYRGFG